ncbi:hypothetical protein SLS60_008999 [Paraconiothyrium brasiliense]|uniref:Rhodopsin domain-containing protein n=1 Tax=Paraconiothyrium brasiliense TaxID=300254 RepID=A0ABR3QWE1_9PLEO
MPVAWATGAEKVMKRQASSVIPSLSAGFIAYTNAQRILSITGTFFTAALLIVLLRCYVRVVMLRVFGKDDYMMVVSTVFATISFACFVIETQNGLGNHLMVLLMDVNMYKTFAKVLYVHSLMVMVGLSCVKISIAFSLLRLSATKQQTRFLQVTIIFIVAITLACAGTLIFQCLPVEAAWDSSLRPAPLGTGNARCYNNTTFRNLGLMNSVFNIITDILFATLPIPLIWKLQINMRTKMSLIVVLSFGWFACAAGIVKAAQQYTVVDDPDWSVNDSFNVWNYIELTIGIVAASLPALKPLFNWALQTVSAISSGGRTKGTGRPSAYTGAHSLGYHNMESQHDKGIPMHSIRSRRETITEPSYPYSVQVSTQHSQLSGRADKEAWDVINSKDSNESTRPFDLGPKDISVTTEVRIT